MTDERFIQLGLNAVRTLVSMAPKDTGNLAYNGIRYEMPDAKTFVIYVDQNIAPYMPYTNEPWTSSKWNGRRNPNQGWFDKAAALVARTTANEVGGKVTK